MSEAVEQAPVEKGSEPVDLGKKRQISSVEGGDQTEKPISQKEKPSVQTTPEKSEKEAEAKESEKPAPEEEEPEKAEESEPQPGSEEEEKEENYEVEDEEEDAPVSLVSESEGDGEIDLEAYKKFREEELAKEAAEEEAE